MESGLLVAEGRLNESEIHGGLRRIGSLLELRFQFLARLFISRARSGLISAELPAEGEEVTILAAEGAQACGWLGQSGLEKANRVVVSSRDQGEPDLDFEDVVVICGSEERIASRLRRLSRFPSTRQSRANPARTCGFSGARARSRSTIACASANRFRAKLVIASCESTGILLRIALGRLLLMRESLRPFAFAAFDED